MSRSTPSLHFKALSRLWGEVLFFFLPHIQY